MTSRKQTLSLKEALAKQEEAKRELKRRREEVLEKLTEQELAGNKKLEELQARIDELKAKRHRHRLDMSRKKFSIKRREEHLERIRAEWAEQKETDDALSADLEDIEKQIKKIENEARKAARARKKKPLKST